jgi:hypothetical protein
MSDRRVLDLTRAGMDRADHDFAGVDTDAALDRAATVGNHSRRIPFKVLLHPECRIERTLRMVLVGDRGAEQCEDAVAGRLNHIAVVAMRGVDHQLQRRIDDRAGLLGVEVFHQFGRALDVSEQRRHRLALAVWNFAARLPGTYSDTRRIVAYGFLRSSGWPERGATFLAELCAGRVGQAALWAAALKRFTAFDAKLCACGILGAAFGTGHSPVSPSSSSSALASRKSAVSKPSVNQL